MIKSRNSPIASPKSILTSKKRSDFTEFYSFVYLENIAFKQSKKDLQSPRQYTFNKLERSFGFDLLPRQLFKDSSELLMIRQNASCQMSASNVSGISAILNNCNASIKPVLSKASGSDHEELLYRHDIQRNQSFSDNKINQLKPQTRRSFYFHKFEERADQLSHRCLSLKRLKRSSKSADERESSDDSLVDLQSD